MMHTFDAVALGLTFVVGAVAVIVIAVEAVNRIFKTGRQIDRLADHFCGKEKS